MPMRRVAVLVLVPFALVACASDSNGTTTLGTGKTAAPFPGEPPGVKTYVGLARNHVDTPVDHPQTPPVGGPHSPVWQNCEYYDTSVPNERAVHSMEHGAVWITYLTCRGGTSDTTEADAGAEMVRIGPSA